MDYKDHENHENPNLHSYSEDTTNHEEERPEETSSASPVQVETSKSETEEKQTQKSAGTFKMLLSSVVGGLVVALVGTGLITTGVIPLDDENETTPTEQSSEVDEETSASSDVVQTLAAEEEPESLQQAIEQNSEAVVGVSNIQEASLWSESQATGTGSGVIYKEEDGKAYVVTNYHVVEGANELEVVLANGDKVEAELLGGDQLSDLAVLRIDGSKVEQVAKLGSSENLQVGQTAIAIGNPLGTEFAGSVTKGIISGLNRSVEMDLNTDGQPDWTTEVIQTDAAINPGNSGGALINANGEVIGINSMKIAQEAVEGIGFAIPMDTAKPIIQQLEDNGHVERPFMGISAIALNTVPERHKQQTLNLSNDVTDGVVVADVQVNSPADQASLQKYDVITKINDKAITNMLVLKQYLYENTEIGDKIDITYYRDGQQQTTSLTLAAQNQEQSQQQ
ncbi:S1C family serine protease [Radiobacillus kanasensis]|uniref:S1C family serine protease n=1 Tax=Radiobacillus kanasensis TaxID=2844358 RepID=UPI001E38138D|nr:S1C family serine protease [Radiobacillus kanasensis]UFT99781.1 S1C family serine protease [Radiobacillus kanasensis]